MWRGFFLMRFGMRDLLCNLFLGFGKYNLWCKERRCEYMIRSYICFDIDIKQKYLFFFFIYGCMDVYF